jgi:hypothetical protein
MESRFKTEREFLDAVNARFVERQVPADVRAAILSGIEDAGRTVSQGSRVNPSAMNLRLGTWFIRKDDVPIFDALAAAGGLAVTLTTGGAVAPASAATGIANAAKMVWQVWRKGARLSKRQVLLLNLLHTNAAQSVEEITGKLQKAPEPLESTEAEEVLRSLEMVELHDGTIVPLARRDDDGRWRSLDV